jgi:hypothetical protein
MTFTGSTSPRRPPPTSPRLRMPVHRGRHDRRCRGRGPRPLRRQRRRRRRNRHQPQIRRRRHRQAKGHQRRRRRRRSHQRRRHRHRSHHRRRRQRAHLRHSGRTNSRRPVRQHQPSSPPAHSMPIRNTAVSRNSSSLACRTPRRLPQQPHRRLVRYAKQLRDEVDRPLTMTRRQLRGRRIMR